MKNKQLISEIMKKLTLSDPISIHQKNTILSVLSNKTLLSTAAKKGCFGEIFMDLLLKECGCKSCSAIVCTSLVTPGHTGLDGIYEVGNVIIVAEAKYGHSRLITTKTGKQMSNEWIDPRLSNLAYTSNSRLDKAIGRTLARKKIDAIKSHDLFLLRLLIRVKPDFSFTVNILDENGRILYRNIGV